MSQRAPWENEVWTPEPLWRGETAFILASGPSLTKQDIAAVRGRKTIAVNSTCLDAPWADILFFTDSGWYEPRKEIVANWPGMVVSMSRTAKREMPQKVKRVLGEVRPDFPKPGSPAIRQGRSSGQSAASLAIAMGSPCVVLLGFDMKNIDGRSHHHEDYTRQTHPDVFKLEFLPAFKGWNDTALAAGVDILNATPGSAITEFPMVELNEVLGGINSDRNNARKR